MKLSSAQTEQSFLLLKHWDQVPSQQGYGYPEEPRSVRNFSWLLHHVTESFGPMSFSSLSWLCVHTRPHTGTNITPVKTLLKAPRISVSLWGDSKQPYLDLNTVLNRGLDKETARGPFHDPIKTNVPCSSQHHVHAYCSVIAACFPPRSFTRLLRNIHNVYDTFSHSTEISFKVDQKYMLTEHLFSYLLVCFLCRSFFPPDFDGLHIFRLPFSLKLSGNVTQG